MVNKFLLSINQLSDIMLGPEERMNRNEYGQEDCS